MRAPTLTREIILEVGSEGGSLTLLRGKDAHGKLQFWMEVNETALYDLLSEEDRGDFGEHFSQTGCVHSFHCALSLLDRYPWFRLRPIQVHPEFWNSVLLEVKQRGGANAEVRWRKQLKHRILHLRSPLS